MQAQPPSATKLRRMASLLANAFGVRSSAWLGHIVFMSRSAALKESAEERRRFIRNADDLVRCLTIEFEIERGASDGDAHARRLPGDPAFFCDRFGRGDDAVRDETWPAFVLAREDKDRIAFGDVLATIH